MGAQGEGGGDSSAVPRGPFRGDAPQRRGRGPAATPGVVGVVEALVGEPPGAGVVGEGAKPAGGGEPRVVRLDLEFDGRGFEGWQRQAEGRTVQATLEDTLSRLLRESVRVVGSGRTDAGVHARGMVASFRTRSAMPAATLQRALDALLPEDVAVLAATDAGPTFHALRDARWKWYRYTILRSRTRRVFWRASAWRVGASLAVSAAEEASKTLLGTHDLAAFQSSGSPRRSTVRTLAALRWSEEGPLLHVDLVADGFLYGMARAIVGTLVEVARGQRTPGSVADLLASRDRRRAGAAAPAHGLTLMAVGTRDDPAPGFVDPSLARALESRSSADDLVPADLVAPRGGAPPCRS